jgi:glycosyltransferase involved in cell wall biosynthesis
MRIFLLANVLLNVREGRTTHVLELLENLSKHNDVICLAPRPPKIKYKSKNLVYIPVVHKRILYPISYQLLLFLYILYYSIQRKPDAIYARHYKFPFAQFIISRLLGIPNIVEINGIVREEMKMSDFRSNKLRTYFENLGENFNYKHADKLVAVSEGIKYGIMRLYDIPGSKILVIENGADIELFKPIDREEVMKELELDNGCSYIGFSGSFARYHGIEALIASAELIISQISNVKFLFVGDGELKEHIVKVVDDMNLREKFIFINRVAYAESPKYINAFDIGVILKRRDIPGSPLKLWEYMACGKPVIATNTSDFEIIKKCNCGILVDAEKPADVANAIVTLLKDKKLRKEMGENGRRYVVGNQSWACVAEKVETAIKDAVQNK